MGTAFRTKRIATNALASIHVEDSRLLNKLAAISFVQALILLHLHEIHLYCACLSLFLFVASRLWFYYVRPKYHSLHLTHCLIVSVGIFLFFGRLTLLGQWDSRTSAAANISLVNSMREHKRTKRHNDYDTLSYPFTHSQK